MFDPSNSYGRSPYASSGFGGVRPNTRQLGRSPYDTVPAMHTQPWSPSGGPGYGTTQPWSPNTRQPSPTSNFFGYSPGGRGRGPGFGGGM